MELRVRHHLIIFASHRDRVEHITAKRQQYPHAYNKKYKQLKIFNGTDVIVYYYCLDVDVSRELCGRRFDKLSCVGPRIMSHAVNYSLTRVRPSEPLIENFVFKECQIQWQQ